MSGVTFGSLAWYYFPVYGGAYWFSGPVRTIEGDPSIKQTAVIEVDQTDVEEDRKDTISEEGSF
jgi:hypothetical protein